MADSRFRSFGDLATAKLAEIRSLPEGWHYGEGTSFSREVLDTVRELLEFGLANGLPETDLFPGLCGEAGLTFYWNAKSMELTVNEDLTIEAIVESGSGSIEEWESLSVERAKEMIMAFGEKS